LTVLALSRLPAASYNTDDPFSADLEELLQMPVLSAAKREEPLFESTAAITILDQRFLASTPARQVPDMLRYVPGLTVAQGNSNNWAVSSRGTPFRFANSLLVLHDGRSVYTPLFSGVFWDTQKYLREDFAQIEVVRGPGGTLWGANAVDGVINMRTKAAADTQGTLLSVASGNELKYGFGLRYGGQLSENGFYRVSLVTEGRDGGEEFGNFDESESINLSARYDLEVDEDTLLKIQFEAFRADSVDRLNLPNLLNIVPDLTISANRNEGTSLLGKWERLDDGSGSSYYVQSYVDFLAVDSRQARADVLTWDLEGLYRLQWSDRNDLSMGLGARLIQDDWADDRFAKLQDYETTTTIFNAFLQNDFEATDHFRITAGVKFEYHASGVGLEVQPNLRLLFRPSENQRIWAAASHVSRIPSRLEAGLDRTLFAVVPLEPSAEMPFDRVAYTSSSADDHEAEHVTSFELGYRVEFSAAWSLEVNAFDKELGDELGFTESVTAEFDPVPHLAVDARIDNTSQNRKHGAEASLRWHPNPTWEATLGLAYLSAGDNEIIIGQSAPELQGSLTLLCNPADDWRIFAGLRYQSEMTGMGNTFPARWDGDLAIHWDFRQGATISLEGLHLFREQRAEYAYNATEAITATEVERQLAVQIKIVF